MKEQVLKLCRRLKSYTLSDLTQFLEVEESVVETIVLYLEQEQLIQITNGVITLAEIKNPKMILEIKVCILCFNTELLKK